MRGFRGAAIALGVVLMISGCSAQPALRLPPSGVHPDYQLGGAYDPPAGVGIVARDRAETPPEGIYSICYINGFQTQPGERGLWPDDLLLHDESGAPLIDPGWPDEVVLDTSSAVNRDGILEVVAPWVRGCADAGFDAVEFDNLDSFTRSRGALTADDNTALAVALFEAAHDAGLAAGQKNTAELAERLHHEAGFDFDFAVVEECAQFAECTDYTAVYGGHVIMIEYSDALDVPFAEVCADAENPASVVLRDRDLVTPDDPAYVFELC